MERPDTRRLNAQSDPDPVFLCATPYRKAQQLAAMPTATVYLPAEFARLKATPAAQRSLVHAAKKILGGLLVEPSAAMRYRWGTLDAL